MKSSRERSRQREHLMQRLQAPGKRGRFTQLNEGRSGAVILSGATSGKIVGDPSMHLGISTIPGLSSQ